MRQKIVILVLVLLGFISCGEYQQVLKSKDPEYKYQMALKYFNEKKYNRSQALLDEVASYYKGTERSQDVLVYLSRSYMGMKDYSSAAQYYAAYIRSYPKGNYITEARFQTGHCYYLDSPDARLDQEITHKAIESFQEFVELYPSSPYAEQAYQEMGEMYDKLAYKELLSGQLYYDLGTYLGNNYLSAQLVAENALKDFPSNKYLEDFNWLILQSKYQQMANSTSDKLQERARKTVDECYNFQTEFPNSKHIKECKKYLKAAQALAGE